MDRYLSKIARGVCAAALLAATAAVAQVEKMPESVQSLLAEVGPVWGRDVPGNIAKTLAVYTPILAAAPKDGIAVVRDLSYDKADRNVLDIYRPEGRNKMPIVVFIHGGAYIAGNRTINAEVYGNVPTYFARQGMLGVNATYRLAPAGQWPSGAQDVAAIVKWLKAHGAEYGGDPERIYLVGHSAGATHVASYVYIDSLHPATGPGIAGMVLISGRYEFDPKPDDPSLKGFQAYFGTDRSSYPAKSPLNHVKTAARLPTFLAVSEYDNPELDVQGAKLLAALCERDRACPRFTRMLKHNHLSSVYQFNTADEAMGNEILSFISTAR